jgi:hypothetical protein
MVTSVVHILEAVLSVAAPVVVEEAEDASAVIKFYTHYY